MEDGLGNKPADAPYAVSLYYIDTKFTANNCLYISGFCRGHFAPRLLTAIRRWTRPWTPLWDFRPLDSLCPPWLQSLTTPPLLTVPRRLTQTALATRVFSAAARMATCLERLIPSNVFLMFSFLIFCVYVTVYVCHTALKGYLIWRDLKYTLRYPIFCYNIGRNCLLSV